MPPRAVDPERTTQRGSRPERLSEQLRLRRAVTLLVMSALVPGSAQIATGNARVGRVALRTWLASLALVAVVGLLALTARGFVIGLAFRPAVLLVVQLALVGVALGGLGLLADALRLARPGLLAPRPRLGVVGLAAVLGTAIAAPPLLAAEYARAQRDLVSSVFGSGDAVATHDGRINVLLLGGDSGRNRVGTRPDSITLVSTDVARGDTVMFSLPRNLERARFPEGSPLAERFPRGFPGMLNTIHTYGTEHPKLFPGVRDPGAEATKQAVGGTLGRPVHYYVLVDLRGFQGLIDALGGIRLRVGERVPIGGGTSPIVGWIEPGLQRLDGFHALWYARSREGSSDYDRMARQRCVMGALMRQSDPSNVARRFQAVARSTKRMVATDIPQAALPDLAELALRARGQQVSSVQFVPPLISSADPDHALIASTVETAIEKSREAAQRRQAQGDAVDRKPDRKPDRKRMRPPAEPDGAGEARASREPVAVEAVCGYR